MIGDAKVIIFFKMTYYEIIKLNKEPINRLNSAGFRLEDCQYVAFYLVGVTILALLLGSGEGKHCSLHCETESIVCRACNLGAVFRASTRRPCDTLRTHWMADGRRIRSVWSSTRLNNL